MFPSHGHISNPFTRRITEMIKVFTLLAQFGKDGENEFAEKHLNVWKDVLGQLQGLKVLMRLLQTSFKVP